MKFFIVHCALCIAALSTAIAADNAAFGICEHVAWSAGAGGEYENRTTVFDRCAAAGIEWVRFDVRWDYCRNRDNGNWSWWQIDEVFNSAEAHGVQLLPILCGKNPMTNAEAQNDLEGWEEFVSLFTTRYTGRFTAVEIWNEPDNTAWGVIPAAQFISIMQRAYTAIKAVDSTVTVVLGGVTAGGTSYLSSLYSNGVKNYCDAVAYHPYVWPDAPGSSYTAKINSVKSIMSSNGDGLKPLWLTEVGWPTHSSNKGVTEAQQASYITNAAAIAFANGVAKYFVYELKAPETDSTDAESHFGILHSDYTFKPAYLAYRDYIVRKESGAADSYANAVFLLSGDNYNMYSFDTAGNWSDGAAPHSDADYLVANLGSAGLWHYSSATFWGRSLAIGRVGGLAGRVRNTGWGSTMTVGSLALNNGWWVVAAGSSAASGATLAGAATVNSPDSAPFVFTAATTNAFTLASTLSGAGGTALRFVSEGNSVFDATLSCDASSYAGVIFADGANTTMRLADAAIRGPFGAGAVTLRSGAALSPAANGQRLSSSSRTLASDGTGRIAVEEGQTLTFAAPISGTFLKTGAGTLVLDGDMTGSGRIAVRQGVVRVDIDTAQFISAIEGGQVVYCVPDGSLNSAQSIATVTVPGPLAPGDVVVSTGAAAPGWTASVRYETDGQGDCTAYIDVAATPRTTMGTDSFEAYGVGAAATSLTGWSGEGAVAAGTPTTGDPPGVPLPNETHTRVLKVDGDGATRTYGDALARDNQSLDFLIQVVRQSRNDWQTALADDGALQLRLAVDPDGAPWILHGDAATGAPVWTRLGYSAASGGSGGAALPSFVNGQWLRVSFDLDYTTSATAAYAQVRLDGSCMLAPSGARVPGGAASGGSWFRLPAAAVSAKKIASVEFQGSGVDDVVLAYHSPSLSPDFPMGAVTSADGIPFSWFDGFGIPRDAAGDPDADGLNNLAEYTAGTDPLDAAENLPAPMKIIVR